MLCKICNSSTSVAYTLEEKMFGFGGAFKYDECSVCGCLQIDQLPKDMDTFYPPYYYAFRQENQKLNRLPFFKRLVAGIRIKKKYKKGIELFRYLREINSGVKDKILDFGCGSGYLICNLFNQGFENIEGVDMFLPNEIDYGFGVKVHKKEASQLPQKSYDLVMMHHVLEHMPDQQKALVDIHGLLKDNGCVMIRIPVIGEAWKLYRENWVQLDAPRHFFLHTIRSLNILAEQTGFEVRKTFFDSTGFQFMGSELYERGIPLFAKEDNYEPFSFEKLFSPVEIKEFENRAEELNRTENGDSAVFYLYKKKV